MCILHLFGFNEKKNGLGSKQNRNIIIDAINLYMVYDVCVWGIYEWKFEYLVQYIYWKGKFVNPQ